MAFFPEHWQPAADGLANKLGIQKHAQRLCQKHLQPRYQRTVLPLIRSGFCFWISHLSKPTARLSLRGSSLNTTLFVTPPLHLRQLGSNINSLVLFPLLATQNISVYCLPEGARTPDAQRRAASRRAMSFKFEHIVFNVCTHTGGAIRRLSAAHSNDCLERCSRRGAARRGAARSVCEPLKSTYSVKSLTSFGR